MIKNPQILQEKLLSNNWYVLRKYTVQFENSKGKVVEQEREAYDRGNGAVILLYNKTNETVILTRQFRLPTFVNGNSSGMMIEACAGLLDAENPDDCIRRETEEETGYRIHHLEKVFEAYMSPGSVTEKLHFYLAEYNPEMKVNDGGGLESEEENIEVLEMPFEQAYSMVQTGSIQDAKTIMLLQLIKIRGIFS